MQSWVCPVWLQLVSVVANAGKLCEESQGQCWKRSHLWFLTGLFSSIMRELANISHDGPKWILLDGDIDPMWIESLNTVMDDNKVLWLGEGRMQSTFIWGRTPCNVSPVKPNVPWGSTPGNPDSVGWPAQSEQPSLVASVRHPRNTLPHGLERTCHCSPCCWYCLHVFQNPPSVGPFNI